MRKVQLVLAAGAASALTAMATLVGLADAEPNVVPANTEAPAVVGTAQDGELVIAKDGEWSGTNPMTFTYQWQRCDGNGNNCANIASATDKAYRVATADVDHRLKVHGLDSLRVIDASIFPTVTSGNTNAPAIMVGEKGADLVLADAT